MPKDGGARGRRKKKPGSPKIYEETMQVRVRSKNPLIERKASQPIDDDNTRGEIPLDQQATKRPESVAVASLYDDIEHTERTELVVRADESEAETERPLPSLDDPDDDAPFIDEDETVIAVDGTLPKQPWAEEHTNDFRAVRRPKRGPTPPASDGAVPRGRVAMTGTKGAGAAVRRQMIENADVALPEVKAPALKIVRAELKKHELWSLDRALAGELDNRHSEGSLSPKRTLERLVNEREYNELVPAHRASMLRAIAKDPGDVTTVKAAIALAKTAVLRHLRPEAVTQLLEVFEHLGADARVHLAQIAARRLRRRSVLEDRDIEDVGLIEHLHALIRRGEFAERIEASGARRRKVANLVVGAIANPHKLSFEEGSDGVLSTIEFALADTNPAELLRFWRGVVSDAMSVSLPGGGTLDLSTTMDRSKERVTFSGQLTPLRLGLMTLAELARPSAKQRRPTFTMPGGHGIDADVVSRALERIFGVGFTVAAGAANARRHLERVDANPHRLPPVFVSLLYSRGERLFLFDHLDAEYVYVRAPHGRSTKREGAYRMDPRREVVDPNRGLDRVPIKSFGRHVGVGLVPRV
ncbi:MAG: hypothetical protein RIT81_29935 [Deltaproteobacteria bacterium]